MQTLMKGMDRSDPWDRIIQKKTRRTEGALQENVDNQQIVERNWFQEAVVNADLWA